MSETTVVVLGAGCSVKYGYPLAKEFVPALESFRASLGVDAEKLKNCIGETIQLLRDANAQTVDELVFRLHTRALDRSSQSSMQAYMHRLRQISNAKLATAALFLSLEQQAKAQPLEGYQRMILRMLPGSDPLQKRFRETRFRLMTFNYDRLFELELLRLFGVDSNTQLLYGDDILNAGLNHCLGESMGFREDRFCFLKLHGSIGMRVREEYGQTRYYAYIDGERPGQVIDISDERFFANASQPLPQDRDPEPLIVFPVEKEFVRSGSENRLAFRDYIKTVWKQAERIMESAAEIWFIGYSFAMMDRPAVVKLLSHAGRCKRVIIQNRPGEAQRICKALAMEHPELTLRFVPYEQEF